MNSRLMADTIRAAHIGTEPKGKGHTRNDRRKREPRTSSCRASVG